MDIRAIFGCIIGILLWMFYWKFLIKPLITTFPAIRKLVIILGTIGGIILALFILLIVAIMLTN